MLVSKPAKKEVINAAAILNTPNTHPINEYVTIKLSAPIWGVEIRNETVAPFDAPFFLKETATGITPQEHNGSGIPPRDDFTTELKLLLPICFVINVSGKKMCNMPATKNPNTRYRS